MTHMASITVQMMVFGLFMECFFARNPNMAMDLVGIGLKNQSERYFSQIRYGNRGAQPQTFASILAHTLLS